MVGMPVVGSVGVTVRPTFKNTQRTIGKEFTGAGSSAGTAFNNSFTRTLSAGAKIAATAGVAALATTLTQGFKRLTAMEDAKAALAGLGYEAKDVESIMRDVEGALNDTIFLYGDGASVAAGALAAGVEQGEELEAYLRLTADAATQAGVDFNDMGMIMNKVTGDGRLMGDTVQQLAENGIYVLPMLAEEFGTTQEEMRKMVSNGEIDAATFQRVMEENIGGSAARASETTRGALSLAWSSVGQLGEALLENLMPHIRGAAQSFTEFMYAMQPVATEIGQRLIPVVEGLFTFLANNTGLVGGLAAAVAVGTAAWITYRAVAATVSFVTGGINTAMEIGKTVVAGYSAVVAGGARMIRGYQLEAAGATKVIERLNWQVKAGAGLNRAYTGTLAAGRSIVDGFQMGAMGMSHQIRQMNGATRLGGAAYQVYGAGAQVAAAGQRAFNIATMNVRGALMALGGVMKAHPIMAIASVLAAAVAGLSYFFTQTETGQKIWESLKDAMQPVIDTVMPALESVGDSVGSTFSSLAESAAPVLENIVTAVSDFLASVGPALMSFGTTLLESLLPVFETIGEALMVVFQAIGEYLAPMLAEIGEALAPLLPMFAEAGQQIMEAFAPVVEQVMNELVPAFMELWQALAGLVPMLIEALAPILPLIAETFGMLVEAIAPLVPMLIEALAPILPVIAEAFMMLLGAIFPIIPLLVEALAPIIPIIIEGFTMLVGAIMPLIPLLIEAIAPIIPVIVEAFMALVQAILPLIPMLIEALAPILVELVTIFAELVAQLAPLVLAIIEAVIPAILAILPALMQLVVLVIEMVIPVIQAILNVVVTVFEALAPIISAALTIVQGVIQTITALITGDWSAAWDGIKMILSGAWELMKSIVMGAIEIVWSIISNAMNLIGELWDLAWNAMASVLSWVWETLIQPVFRALGEFLKWVYDTFISPVIDWILDKWDTMSSNLRSVYDTYIKPMFDRFGEIVTGLGDKFETAKDNIKKAWDKVKEVAAKPINFVINRVLNEGLIDGFNKLVDWIPGVDGLSHIPVPGWLEDYGYAAGGYTGPGQKYDPAGIVHAGEFVLQQTATNKLMRRFGMAGMDYMNRTGEIPAGYSSGGLVQPVRGPVTSTFGPRWGSHHSGIDWAVPTGTPVAAALAGTVLKTGFGNVLTGRTGGGVYLGHEGDRQTYYGHLSKILVSVGDEIAKGQTIALSGNTGNSTGPHLHFETHSGGKALNPAKYLDGAMIPEGDGSGGGGFDILAPFRAIGEKITGWFKDRFPDGGIIVDAAVNAAKGGFDRMLDWASSLLPWGSDGGEGGTVAAEGAKAEVQDVAAQYGWGSGVQWSALSQLIDRESSWNPNAANPSSSARGLFQKMTSLHGPVESTAAGQAEWGLNYIQGRYGNPASALAFHKRNNHYADGGFVNPLFRDRGGTLPPGLSMVLNKTGQNEAILNAQQWSDIHSLAQRGSGQSGLTIHGDVHTTDIGEMSKRLHDDSRRARAVGLEAIL